MNHYAARKSRTRNAIRTSAARLFADRGYARTTVAQIVAGANVSERTFFVHFASKEDLLFAHVHEFAEVAWAVADSTPSPHPVDRVRAAVAALVDAACTDEALRDQASARAALSLNGLIPASLARQLVELASELTLRVARGTASPAADVAPMVGAAIGAVEAAGLVGADEAVDSHELHRRMMDALDASLVGFGRTRGHITGAAPV